MPDTRKRLNHLGDIDVTYAGVMYRLLAQRGLAAQALFDQYGLSPARLGIPQARISIPRFMRLGHAAIELSGDPALGLAMGRQARVTDMGLAGLAAMAAPTLGAALETLIRFERLTSYSSRGHSRFIREPGHYRAEFYSISPYNDFNYFVVDTVLSRWVSFLDFLKPGAGCVSAVHIEYPHRGVDAEFAAHFDCPVVFAASNNGLILEHKALDQANPLGQPALFKTLNDRCEKDLERLRSGWSLMDRVKEELAPRLRKSPPSLAVIAEALGTTPWTLRRRLGLYGTTFRKLIAETRQELAQEYVRDTRLSYAEIAFILGFSTPAPFHRAFRRWTGMSAGQYRKESQHNSGKGLV